MIPAIIAPLLTQGLSLISNAVLAKGKEYIEEKTGVKLEDNMSEENILKLKQYELEHEEELLKLKIEENKIDLEAYKLEVQDKESARDREVELNASPNASWLSKNNTSIIALVFILAYLIFVVLSAFVVDGIDVRQEKFDIIFTSITNISLLIVGYYFGSSKDRK